MKDKFYRVLQVYNERGMNNILNYNDVFAFMQEFEVDFLNRFNELIIDELTNTYATISEQDSIDDVITKVVFSMCRPIGKGLKPKDSTRLLNRINNYFDTHLTKQDMLLMCQELCYVRKFEEFKQFINDGFPIYKLEGGK